MQSSTAADIIRNDIIRGSSRIMSYTKGNVTVNCRIDYETSRIYTSGSTYDGVRYRKIMLEADAFEKWTELDDEYNKTIVSLAQTDKIMD